MRYEKFHIPDHDLLRAVDGELSARETVKIQAHLASCWTCRTRMRQLEGAIADFVQMHQESLDSQLPPADGARALLKLRMAELAAAPAPTPWRRLFSLFHDRGRLPLACSILILVGLGMFAVSFHWPSDESRTTLSRLEAQPIPDPSLTPGATLPVSTEHICAEGIAETVRLVPTPVALRVFAAYGIHKPQPRAYELDYLITPALGGADNIRNLWPQPYRASIWNAHIKDALEDHLYRLVCAGHLDLATAQRDISQDWIAAYKKYFRTDRPLPEHASFLKDRPWE
ncbi:MAG: anti-sigma factor family protein [Bryobacteraceae bacterium]